VVHVPGSNEGTASTGKSWGWKAMGLERHGTGSHGAGKSWGYLPQAS
jgi:hypothetical protein